MIAAVENAREQQLALGERKLNCHRYGVCGSPGHARSWKPLCACASKFSISS